MNSESRKRALSVVFGLLVVGLSLLAPGLRDAEGAVTTPFALLGSMGVGLVVLAAMWGRLPSAAVGYFGILLIGSAAQLQLAHQGPTVSYQHLFTLPELLSGRAWYAQVLVLMQLLLVALGLRGLLGPIAHGVRKALPGFRLVGVLAVFVMTSATLSKDVVAYLIELVMASGLQLLTLANVVLVVASLPEGAATGLVDRLLGPEAEATPRRTFDPVAVAAALWVLALTVTLNLGPYESNPHVPDEVVYIYPAKYLAEGKLWVDLPRAADAFNVDLMFYDREGGRMWSPVPIGWPLVLSVGTYFGVPFLVNPTLGALCVLLCFAFMRRLLGPRPARLAVLLMASSPWFLFLCMSFMTHTSSLLGALVAAYCVIRLRDSGQFLWAIPGGMGIGYASLVRPLEGMAVAVVLGLWTLSFRPLSRALIADALLALSTVVVSAITLPYNKLFTGDPLYFPIMHYTDIMYGKDSNAMGFGPNRGLGWPGLDPFPGHGPIDVVVNSNFNAYAINVELFGWTTGSLGLLALLWFSGTMKRLDWAAAGAAFTIIFAHAFYWFAGGPDFGARYWYMTYVPLLLMAVRGVFAVVTLAQRAGVAAAQSRVILGVVALCVVTLVDFMPWRSIDKYYHFRGMRSGMRQLTAELSPGKALFLVRGRRHPDYASSFTLNPTDFDSDAPIYAWEQTPEITAELLAAYPDRPVYIVNGPSESGSGFELMAGPLPASQVPKALLEASR